MWACNRAAYRTTATQGHPSVRAKSTAPTKTATGSRKTCAGCNGGARDIADDWLPTTADAAPTARATPLAPDIKGGDPAAVLAAGARAGKGPS